MEIICCWILCLLVYTIHTSCYRYPIVRYVISFVVLIFACTFFIVSMIAQGTFHQLPIAILLIDFLTCIRLQDNVLQYISFACLLQCNFAVLWCFFMIWLSSINKELVFFSFSFFGFVKNKLQLELAASTLQESTSKS